MSLALLRPLIVPMTYFELGNFPAPYIPLRSPDLALTCVTLGERTIAYVRPDEAREWERQGIEWRTAALDALRTADEGLIWTEERRDEEGALAWIGFMNDDGLGSSRLLLDRELEELFPGGYYVALPDRSCGMAISKHLGGDVLGELREAVAKMQASATIPMCPDLRESSALLESIT